MTNILATLTIVVVTNWTGVKIENKEVGLIQKEHYASFDYKKEAFKYKLRTDTLDKVVWRPWVTNEMVNGWILTASNICITTNILWDGRAVY